MWTPAMLHPDPTVSNLRFAKLQRPSQGLNTQLTKDASWAPAVIVDIVCAYAADNTIAVQLEPASMSVACGISSFSGFTGDALATIRNVAERLFTMESVFCLNERGHMNTSTHIRRNGSFVYGMAQTVADPYLAWRVNMETGETDTLPGSCLQYTLSSTGSLLPIDASRFYVLYRIPQVHFPYQVLAYICKINQGGDSEVFAQFTYESNHFLHSELRPDADGLFAWTESSVHFQECVTREEKEPRAFASTTLFSGKARANIAHVAVVPRAPLTPLPHMSFTRTDTLSSRNLSIAAEYKNTGISSEHAVVLLFKTGHVWYCNPAVLERGGVLFTNAAGGFTALPALIDEQEQEERNYTPVQIWFDYSSSQLFAALHSTNTDPHKKQTRVKVLDLQLACWTTVCRLDSHVTFYPNVPSRAA